MDRKINFLVLTAVVVAFFSSCSNEEVYDPTKAAELKKAQYDAAFVERYGIISPNQDWGFSENPSTRGAVTNNNEWATRYKLEVPDDWAYIESKTEEIKELFRNPNPAYIVDNIDWSDFFVQYVWHNSSCNMNQLKSHKENDTNGDLVNNFNKSAKSIMFMEKSGTGSFSYEGDGGQRFNNYVILCFEGNYYVGFDYERRIANQIIEPDGDYTDWILKITPAQYTTARRIMAEDLGEIGDFDFNDVVFDAAIVNGGDAVITLLAAGGTLPLYIGGESAEYEVHKRFGVSTGTIVNTAVGKHQNKAPVVFRLAGYANKTIVDIPISVNGMTLKAETGRAPGKLSVPTTTDWANETQAIDNRYLKFKDYVNNPDIIWWKE